MKFDKDRITIKSLPDFKKYVSQSPLVEKRILNGKFNWVNIDEILSMVEILDAYEKKKVFYYDIFWNEIKGDSTGYFYKMTYGNLTLSGIEACYYDRENKLIQSMTLSGDYLSKKTRLKCFKDEKVLLIKYFNLEEDVDSIVSFNQQGNKQFVYRVLKDKVNVFKFLDKDGKMHYTDRIDPLDFIININNVQFHNLIKGHFLKSSFYTNKNGQKVYRYLDKGFQLIQTEQLLEDLSKIVNFSEDELNDNNDYVLKLKVLISAKKEILKVDYLDTIPESYKKKVPEILSFITKNLKGELPESTDLYETLIPILFIKNQQKNSIQKSPFFQPYPYDFRFYQMHQNLYFQQHWIQQNYIQQIPNFTPQFH